MLDGDPAALPADVVLDAQRAQDDGLVPQHVLLARVLGEQDAAAQAHDPHFAPAPFPVDPGRVGRVPAERVGPAVAAVEAEPLQTVEGVAEPPQDHGGVGVVAVEGQRIEIRGAGVLIRRKTGEGRGFGGIAVRRDRRRGPVRERQVRQRGDAQRKGEKLGPLDARGRVCQGEDLQRMERRLESGGDGRRGLPRLLLGGVAGRRDQVSQLLEGEGAADGAGQVEATEVAVAGEGVEHVVARAEEGLEALVADAVVGAVARHVREQEHAEAGGQRGEVVAVIAAVEAPVTRQAPQTRSRQRRRRRHARQARQAVDAAAAAVRPRAGRRRRRGALRRLEAALPAPRGRARRVGDAEQLADGGGHGGREDRRLVGPVGGGGGVGGPQAPQQVVDGGRRRRAIVRCAHLESSPAGAKSSACLPGTVGRGARWAAAAALDGFA